MKKVGLLLILLILVSCQPLDQEALGEQTIEQAVIENNEQLEEQLLDLIALVNSPNLASDEPRKTITQLASSNDERLIPPFVDLLRFAGTHSYPHLNQALQDISGESYERWPDWMIYMANRDDIRLPPGYLKWKGELLSSIDPDFKTFFADGKTQADFFRPELAVWGGVRVANQPGVDKGIPPLEEPKTIPGVEADYLRDSDLVYGVVIKGQARAYPQRIIDWHEMINDVIDNQHLSIAYCTLCGAAIAYDTQLEGTHRTFSSSGMLYESNKLMFDRQTNTLWNHILGTPVLGPLVGEVEELPLLFIERTTWKDWLEDHPETDVLDIDTGFSRDYSVGVPSYNRYYLSANTLFPTSTVRGPLQPKDRIFGLVEEGVARAYEQEKMREEGIINDEFNERSIVVLSRGFGIRAYERGNHVYTLGETLVDEEGNTWDITHQALIRDDEELSRLPSHEAFWFGWVINYPETSVYS